MAACRCRTARAVQPDPILVGRNADKVERSPRRTASSAGPPISTPRSPIPKDEIFFDAGTTQMRPALLEQAIEAGKHVYCEKPTATNLAEALQICRLAEEKGVKNGVVQDKLFLPGLMKLKMLRDSGFFGRMLSVRGEFGYWVFEGDLQPTQRPSWNYRAEDGGGIILDMLCHWRYVLDNVFGEVEASPASARRTSPSAATRPASPTRRPPTTRPTPPSCSTAAWSRRSTCPGRRASIATISSPSRSTARTARRSPGCTTARSSRAWRRRGRSGTRTRSGPTISATWQPCRTTRAYRTASAQWEMFIRHVVEDAP